MAALGQICIVGAFALALYSIVSSLVGVRVRSRELIASGQNAAWAVTALITAASLTLLVAFAVHDFSLRYVWDHSSRAMSMDLILAAFYSGQQGSLLYWAWTLSIFSAIVLWQQRKPGPHRVLMPYVVVALMPWLVGTAFIHSIQVQERRGMLKAWNVALIMVTFFLSIFGTFVVRSGILASVHAFALSAIGPYFLTFLTLVIAGSLGLYFWRLPRLRADNQLDSFLSREASFLINNLLFLGIAFAIFWGTIYPLVAEALADQKVSVGPPYFKQVAGPLLGAMILLMGIGPLMPSRRASRDHLVHNFLLPVASTAIGLAILAVVGFRDPFAILGFGLCLFVLGTIVQEFARGMLARHQATGENYVLALASLIRRNNRRYGGYVVHLAMLLIGVGAVGSQVYQQQTQATLAPGESVSLGRYTITAQGIQTSQPPGVRVIDGVLSVNGQDLRPEKQYFDNFPQQPSTKVGLRSTPFEDLYVVLAGWDGDGPTARVSLAVFVNPLVSWIWTGGVLLLLGTIINMWPEIAPSRQLLTPPSDGP